MTTPEDVRARLEETRARRGYPLPHQGAMAAALPELQDAYAAMYRALTLGPRHLSPFEKEFVWLAILIGCEGHVGTHHVRLFRETGGTERRRRSRSGSPHWRPGREASPCSAATGRATSPGSPRRAPTSPARSGCLPAVTGRARPAVIGVHAARAERWGLAVEIEAAYARGVAEPKMAEAMSLAMWPAGVNRFLEACEVWLGVMRSDRVHPSPSFRAWANMPDRDGFHLPPRAGAAAPTP
ncbi:hypothetical protein GCM10010964_02590 [Caldovatus sediminis]|uniref:Uncharacterized protein n=1 Tax=Caldovatus sediminis TaxID=2041189 RepID=A0A8J2Z7R7_9PROT|nr:hypothetical protein [Caldovatus sediminis]GGG17867.1 hypothetical protein GCM10010964_02590 [Caldovatus sediminis]